MCLLSRRCRPVGAVCQAPVGHAHGGRCAGRGGLPSGGGSLGSPLHTLPRCTKLVMPTSWSEAGPPRPSSSRGPAGGEARGRGARSGRLRRWKPGRRPASMAIKASCVTHRRCPLGTRSSHSPAAGFLQQGQKEAGEAIIWQQAGRIGASAWASRRSVPAAAAVLHHGAPRTSTNLGVAGVGESRDPIIHRVAAGQRAQRQVHLQAGEKGGCVHEDGGLSARPQQCQLPQASSRRWAPRSRRACCRAWDGERVPSDASPQPSAVSGVPGSAGSPGFSAGRIGGALGRQGVKQCAV